MPTSRPDNQHTICENHENVFLFVVWSKARAFDETIKSEIAKRFEILRDFEVSWPRRSFEANLAAFYGWKSWYIWRNKARKCGTGPFRVFVVRDPSPVWCHERDTYGHRLVVDRNVSRLKKEFRKLTGRSNVVHSSVTVEETRHQLAALDSAFDDPIPFRMFHYDNHEQIRSARRRIWLGIAEDIVVPLLASIGAGVAVWFDFHVLCTTCSERGVVEWSGLILSALCGAMMTACAVKVKSGRGAHAILAAIFFDLAIREADYLMDAVFGHFGWSCVLTIVTLTFAFVTLRYAKTVYSGLKMMHRSRRFPIFACGLSLLLFVSQFLGRSGIWESVGVAKPLELGHVVEECVELFGYVLIFSWVLPHTLMTIARKRYAI